MKLTSSSSSLLRPGLRSHLNPHLLDRRIQKSRNPAVSQLSSTPLPPAGSAAPNVPTTAGTNALNSLLPSRIASIPGGDASAVKVMAAGGTAWKLVGTKEFRDRKDGMPLKPKDVKEIKSKAFEYLKEDSRILKNQYNVKSNWIVSS